MALGVLVAGGSVDVLQTHARGEPILTHRKIRMVRGRAMGRFLSLRFAEDIQTVAVHQPGILGFYTKGPVMDLSGQTDRDLARAGTRKAVMGQVLVELPAVVVHPRLRGGPKPGRLPTPDWYPAAFGDAYATTSFSARRRWGLVDRPGPFWLHMFVRRGVPMGHDQSKWVSKQP